MSGVDWTHHNLTTGRVIVRRAASRKLREASDWAEISAAVPNVSAASRERNRRNGSRDVHATIRGTVTATGEGARDVSALRRITYNPFHPSGFFRYSDTSEEWTGSGRVLVTGGYAYEVES